MTESRYQLELSMTVRAMENQGTAANPRWAPSYSGASGSSLKVDRTVDLGALDFMGVAKVLGALHDAAVDVAARAVWPKTLAPLGGHE